MGRLLQETARSQWTLLALSGSLNLLEALGEGITLALMFAAIRLLSSGVPPQLAVLGLPTEQLFLLLMGLAVALQGLQSLMRYGNAVAVGLFAARCRAQITAALHRQILRFSFACASRYRVGDLVSHATQGPEAVEKQITTAALLLVNAVMAVCYLVVLVLLSPWLLLGAGLMGGGIVAVQRSLLPRIRRRAHQLSAANVAVVSRISDDVQGLRLLHSFGQLERAEAALHQLMARLEHALSRQVRLVELTAPLSSFLPVLSFALLASLSVLLLHGRQGGVLPSLATFLLALQRLNQRLAGLALNANSLSRNAGEVARLQALLDNQGKDYRRQGGRPFTGLRQGIVLQQVCLRYSPELPWALDHVDLEMPRGSTTALVGPSGAGKSSIADLLIGLVAPSSGRVLIDGVDLERWQLSSWQQHLGVVSQDTFLFNASVADNIRVGRPEASLREVRAAAARAQILPLIEQLPQGFETPVGERGYRLSGGQRQRLALARALLTPCDLLILDEATSALDSDNEALVQLAIRDLGAACTVLVIAHRLSTVCDADQIVVLEAGRRIEHGDHSTLLRGNGRYAGLWRRQVEGLAA
ncbi:MAG: ABC transporter ATP-binding protein [Cyanobacteriota bacterium]|nr:ABC transporter ATP-binding protein [Cyanobacteriota bacterium]